MKKYQILRARDRFPALFLPFSTSNIVLLLSWYRIFSLIRYPCVSTNNCVHSIFVLPSLHPTSSNAVELCVFIFCFKDLDWTAPLPNVITTPVCDQKSGCTAKLASTYHLMTFKLSAESVKTSFHVRLTYNESAYSNHQQMDFVL